MNTEINIVTYQEFILIIKQNIIIKDSDYFIMIEFQFNKTEDAKQFIIFLIDSGISFIVFDLFSVKYEIEITEISIKDSIQYGKDFLNENGITEFIIKEY